MHIERPVFVIGSYRGGTSMLLRLLSESDELLSLYRESKHMWKKYFRHPKELDDTLIFNQDLDGNFVCRNNGQKIDDLKKEREYFDNHYHYSAYDNYPLGYLSRVRLLRDRIPPLFDLMNIGNYIYKSLRYSNYRFVDKTPPNMYKVGLLAALYPDAKFIYITRNGIDNVNSLMNAWNNDHAFGAPHRKYLTAGLNLNIDGYNGDVWKFFIPEDFQGWLDKPLEEVCAHQWVDAHEHALKDFAVMDPTKYIQLKFEDIQANTEQVIQEVCNFVRIDYSPRLQRIIHDMPLVNTDSKPNPMKKSKNQARLERIVDYIRPMQQRLGYD